MKRYLYALSCLALLAGCAAGGANAPGPFLAQVDDIATGALQTQPAVVEMNGQPALLYASRDNRVVLQQGKQRIFLDETAPVRGGNRFQLHWQDQQLRALWWSHQDAKNLYFTSSANEGQSFAPVSIVNDDHGVLAPFSLLRGPQGVLGVTYQDERQPRYQAYVNRSTDQGRTWARPDQRLDAPPANSQASDVQDPQSVESGTAWVSAWVDAVKAADGRTRYRVMGRRSDDGGLQWSAVQEIYQTTQPISSLAVSAQGSAVVIAADEYQRGIVAFTSRDQGRNWRAVGQLASQAGAFKASSAVSNSGIRMLLAGERAYLVWMQERDGEKPRIMRASLEVAASAWTEPEQRLDVKAYDNTRSVLPTILAAPKGYLLAAWVDYRDIRPNIYLSASFDQGRAWTAPQPLLNPGEVSAGLPRLMTWGDQVALGYEVYPTVNELEGQFVLRRIALEDGAKALPELAKLPSINEAERKAKLEKRVKALWENRVAGNYEPTYDMFDFAYKASTPAKSYLENVGVITYQAFSIEELTVHGNEASAKMKVKYEVKSTPMLNGRTIKLAPVEVEAANTWVWVGNDWYLVYSPSFGQPNLKY